MQKELVDENPYQTQKQFAETLYCAQSVISDRLKTLVKVYKEGKWVPMNCEEVLKDKKLLAKFCLLTKKGFLHRIVTGEKIHYFDNPKHRKTIYDPG